MKIEDLEGASRSQPGALRRALQQIQTWCTGIEQSTGLNPLAPAGGGQFRVAPPPLCAMTVEAVSGLFVVVIELNDQLTGPVLHQIKMSSSIPFERSPDVVTFKNVPDCRFPIASVPNTSKYFAFRSRYYNSDYNASQTLIGGAVFNGVESGP